MVVSGWVWAFVWAAVVVVAFGCCFPDVVFLPDRVA